jgi:hypothetical protein
MWFCRSCLQTSKQTELRKKPMKSVPVLLSSAHMIGLSRSLLPLITVILYYPNYICIVVTSSIELT